MLKLQEQVNIKIGSIERRLTMSPNCLVQLLKTHALEQPVGSLPSQINVLRSLHAHGKISAQRDG